MMMMMAVIMMTSRLHFVYFIYFALKSHLLSSGLKEAALSSEQGEGEKVGGGGDRLLLLLSLTFQKCVMKTTSFLPLLLLLPLSSSAAGLCLTVRVLLEHGSADTSHISSSLLCERGRKCDRTAALLAPACAWACTSGVFFVARISQNIMFKL